MLCPPAAQKASAGKVDRSESSGIGEVTKPLLGPELLKQHADTKEDGATILEMAGCGVRGCSGTGA